MASQHAFIGRVVTAASVVPFEFSGNVVGGTAVTHGIDIPVGRWVISFILRGIGNTNSTITPTMAPYNDTTQAAAGSFSGSMLINTSATGGTTAISAGGGVQQYYFGGTNGPAMVGTIVLFGMQLTLTFSAGANAGTYTVAGACVEVV